jgi:nitric oxide reductase activation protein
LNGNNDADVIEYLSNNAFSSYKNRKFLFVLSDGQPIQTRKGYESGLDTYDYMRKVIQDARDNGIYVFGVALVESVIRMNNELYGKEYTIDATGNLESALMNLIELIQEGNI